MAFKDLLALVRSPRQRSVFDIAGALAAEHGAGLSMLHLVELPAPVTEPFGEAIWTELCAAARDRAGEQLARIAARLKQCDPGAELRQLETFTGADDEALAYEMMHADLVVMERPGDAIARAALETALFKSGRPLLLTPPDWRAPLGRRIMVAWTPTREAARALADAAPLIERAEAVFIVTVDGRPSRFAETGPGVDIAAHIARRGIDVEIRPVERGGRSIEQTLLEEAETMGADLIVMGGYGHSRLREVVFGGVTRTLSETSPLPVFMSH